MNENERVYTQGQHEKEMTRLEIQCKRWFIAFMVVLGMLFATNLAWVIYENSFQDVVVTQDADSGIGGNATIYSGTGDVDVGQSTTDNQDPGQAGQH